ncbi:MAG: hypothetical protein OXQ84_21500 [bacterium]|nr:hypothetical protein [bacterium]
MKRKKQGLGRVTEWKRRVGARPLGATGCMTVERTSGILAAGADIISVITDIALDVDSESRVTAWLDVTRCKERTT